MSYQNWCWTFNEERQCLNLMMDDVVLDVKYRRRLLQQHLPQREAFDLEDAERFSQFQDSLEEHSSLTVSQQFQTCLHAVAALHFLKPSLPQSWHFQFGDIEHWPAEVRCCVLDSGLDRCEFLLLEQDQRSSLCLLLDEQMRLSPTKTLSRYECIRVLNDRLQFSKTHSTDLRSNHWSSAG